MDIFFLCTSTAVLVHKEIKIIQGLKHTTAFELLSGLFFFFLTSTAYSFFSFFDSLSQTSSVRILLPKRLKNIYDLKEMKRKKLQDL